MDNTLVSKYELKEAWRNLIIDIKKNKKLNFELFEFAFSQTYSLLVEHLAEVNISKEYVEIIAEALSFGKIHDKSLENEIIAAAILTERMLNSCVFSGATTEIKPAVVYIIEMRQDISLDFEKIRESLDSLTKIIDTYY